MVGILVVNAQPGQVQAIGRDVHVVIGIGAVEQGLSVNVDASVGVIHGQHAREIIALLVHVGSDVVIPVTLEVDEGDVTLQMA